MERATYIIAESHEVFEKYCYENNLDLKKTRYIRNISNLRSIRDVNILKIGRWYLSPLFDHPNAQNWLDYIEYFKKLHGLKP
jgi:hypothetical protein